jgi:hypothetical protein
MHVSYVTFHVITEIVDMEHVEGHTIYKRSIDQDFPDTLEFNITMANSTVNLRLKRNKLLNGNHAPVHTVKNGHMKKHETRLKKVINSILYYYYRRPLVP